MAKDTGSKARSVYANEDIMLVNELSRINNDKTILQDNRKAILAFDEYLDKRGKTKSGRINYLNTFKIFGRLCRKPFKDMDKDDIEAAFKTLDEGRKKSTTRLYKTRIHWLYRRLCGKLPDYFDKTKEDSEDILQKNKKRTKTYDEDRSLILTRSQLLEVIDAADSMRDRAIMAAIALTGCRPNEILSMDIRDIFENEGVTYFRVYGSDGESRVTPITHPQLGLIHVTNWLNHRPNDPSAPLFVKEKGKVGERIAYAGYVEILKRVRRNLEAVYLKDVAPEKRQLEKEKLWVNNYSFSLKSFRKSRASLLYEDGYTEVEVNHILGWAAGSKIGQKHYARAREETIRQRIQQGKDINADKREATLAEERERMQPKRCTCGQENAPDAAFCIKCGRAQGKQTAAFNVYAELEDAKRQLAEIQEFMAVMKRSAEVARSTKNLETTLRRIRKTEDKLK